MIKSIPYDCLALQNFVQGRIQLSLYLDLGKMRVLRVALIGSSSY